MEVQVGGNGRSNPLVWDRFSLKVKFDADLSVPTRNSKTVVKSPNIVGLTYC